MLGHDSWGSNKVVCPARCMVLNVDDVDDDDDDDDDDHDDDDDDDAMMMTWHMPCHRCVENDMKVVHYEPAEGHSQGDLPKNSCKMMRG